MQTETLSVPEVHCNHCVQSIEGALQPLPGVATAQVDLTGKAVTVTWDESATPRDAIVAAIEEQGYQVGA